LLSRATIAALALLAAGCTALPSSGGSWLSDIHPMNTAALPRASGARGGSFLSSTAHTTQTPAAFAAVGTGQFTRATVEAKEEPTNSGQAGVTLNLVNVPINEAAKTVLSDLLGKNFVVDDRVQGTMTLQTASPVAKAALVDVFETVLRTRGAAIVEEAGFSRILPLEDARVRMPSAMAESELRVSPGLAIQVVPLAYISAAEMQRILQPITPAGGVLRVDEARNLLMIGGTSSELSSIRQTIESTGCRACPLLFTR
jgi:general secretion pathway protein D